MGEKQLELPENLQQSEKAGFEVMKSFLIDNFGHKWLSEALQKCRTEFARVGVIGWQPNDANIVGDISPMPHPWGGQWGYRIRFCAVMADGQVHLCQFYVPQSTLPAFKRAGSPVIQ